MITVIVPALNEEKTVGHVVQLAKNSKNVTEVIVVDDKSMDATVEKARNAGAIVIICNVVIEKRSMLTMHC